MSLNMDDLELVKILNKTTLVEIRVCRRRDQSLVAVKVIKCRQPELPTREEKFLARLQHDNIVVFHEGFQWQRERVIVMEFLGKHDLHALLKRKGDHLFTPEVIKKCLLGILKGLAYCHQQHVIHADIKLENVMMTKEGHVKLIDFGLSLDLPEGQEFVECDHVGTPVYWSRELASAYYDQKDGRYDFSTDSWAAGILLYELVKNDLPYKSLSRSSLCVEIKNFDWSSQKYPDEWSLFFAKVFTTPDLRWTPEKLLELLH